MYRNFFKKSYKVLVKFVTGVAKVTNFFYLPNFMQTFIKKTPLQLLSCRGTENTLLKNTSAHHHQSLRQPEEQFVERNHVLCPAYCNHKANGAL